MVKLVMLCPIITLLFVSIFSGQAKALDLSSQQNLYRLRQWNKFFAQAIFIRSQQNKSGTINDDFDHLLALELFALARHCQWSAISSINNKWISNSVNNTMSNSAKAMSLIAVKREYKKFLTDPNKKDRSTVESLKTKRDHWPLSVNEFTMFTSPKNLRVNVRSQCE